MKHLFYIAIFNIASVVLSILYGFFGGSGGETTEGVFSGIAFTGVITVVASMILTFFQFDLFKSKWYWFFLLIIIGVAELSIIDWKSILN